LTYVLRWPRRFACFPERRDGLPLGITNKSGVISVGGIHETSLRWRVRYQFRHSWARHNISISLLGLGKKVKYNQYPAESLV
jgi:hypothetical protein